MFNTRPINGKRKRKRTVLCDDRVVQYRTIGRNGGGITTRLVGPNGTDRVPQRSHEEPIRKAQN